MKVILSVLLAAMLLFGCVNIADTAKAASFGKNAKEKQALDYYATKYGDPRASGAPRIIEPLVTTSIIDFMPADRVLKYNKDAAAFHIWFFYDNFGENDAISVDFRYVDDGTTIHAFNSKGGGDYGAGSFTLEKPDDGWPLGNYEVIVGGKGVSEKVSFEVIDGPTVTAALPYEGSAASPAGGLDVTTTTIQAFETPATDKPATTAGMTSDPMFLDTGNNYLGGCSLTGKSEFTLDKAMQVSLLQVWYNWASGESAITFSLKKDGADFASGTMVRADCDPYQGNWCNGNYRINKEFPAGSYELSVSSAKMCLKPGATGIVRLYGKASGSAAATAAQLPADVPAHLTGCDYAGSWSTDWGTMEIAQDGSKVTGTYTHDSGKLSGTLVDGVFVGKWSESPSYSEPGDAGDAVFYFTEVCGSFSGTWHYGAHTSGAWSGTWVGTRAS